MLSRPAGQCCTPIEAKDLNCLKLILIIKDNSIIRHKSLLGSAQITISPLLDRTAVSLSVSFSSVSSFSFVQTTFVLHSQNPND